MAAGAVSSLLCGQQGWLPRPEHSGRVSREQGPWEKGRMRDVAEPGGVWSTEMSRVCCPHEQGPGALPGRGCGFLGLPNPRMKKASGW